MSLSWLSHHDEQHILHRRMTRDEIQTQAELRARHLGVQQWHAWQEIVFWYMPNPQSWRFMGAAVYIQTPMESEPTELVSTIFRTDPREEICCPWAAVYSFCETALRAAPARSVLPYVRLVDPDEHSFYHPLRHFDYVQAQWTCPVEALATAQPNQEAS